MRGVVAFILLAIIGIVACSAYANPINDNLEEANGKNGQGSRVAVDVHGRRARRSESPQSDDDTGSNCDKDEVDNEEYCDGYKDGYEAGARTDELYDELPSEKPVCEDDYCHGYHAGYASAKLKNKKL